MARNMEKYRKLIEELQAERKRSLDIAGELLNQSMRDSIDELSLVDNHPADIGTEMYMRERDVAIHDKMRGRISAIDAALRNWEEGNYGLCEHCGSEIPMERLEIIPYTTVCTNCSREEEVEEKHSFYQEPIENGPLNHPFARSFQDELGPTGFDGEDSWQAVARYGTSDSLQDLGTNRDISDFTSMYEDSEEKIGAVDLLDTIDTETQEGTHYSKFHGRSSRDVRVED